MSNFSEWLFGATREELVSYIAKEDERVCRERAKWETKLRSEEERAKKAERERDAAYGALQSAADALVSLWAAIGDRLLAGGRLAQEYANNVSAQCRDAEKACRAALGKTP